MSWLSSFLNPGKGYDAAQQQLDKYYQQAQQYQQPYMQHGLDVYGNLSDAMKSLLDPGGLYDKWSSSYEESQAAKDMEADAKERGLSAASAMGLMGSSPALSAIQRGTAQIGAQDKQNYLQDMMQKYLAGIGIGQNIYGIGASTAGNMANQAMNMGQSSAEMAYGKQNARGNLFGNLLGIAGGIAGSALGGPIGGALGGALGSWSPYGGK